ncbi:hypothetical protein [Cognatiyoonia sp. IB215182]|uniref:hypothetical protein n=1 Tax=Cognatiyoonia sp. IB215182 TaxID=3097353 RepID=UPI002A110648|nr:hypothetical protein [Cognatiyoonia sp. IB215182]MDX8352306.1 hypothetical protein [Cognatiyoonia sp. IB215182]
MKPFTKEVLERGTEVMMRHGMSRRRRGLAVWEVSDEVSGAVVLQHRDFPDGTVQIDTCPQVHWEPVQKLYAAGLNTSHRAFQQPTRSRMWSFVNFSEPDLVFAPEFVSAEKLARLSTHIRHRVIEKVLELADPEDISSFYLEQLPHGGHRPEMYLCVRAWMNRTLKLDDEFEQALLMLNKNEFIESLTAFYTQLKNSAIARTLISSSEV